MAESPGVTPISTVQRLSVYLRTLKRAKESGRNFISSEEIAAINGYTPAQVRKDFSCFGSFGIKGKGYNIDKLIKTLEEILGLSERWRVALVGLGRLGKALAKYKGFHLSKFDIVAIFDIDPEKIGTKYNNISIYSPQKLAQIAKRKKIEIAVVAVPTNSAEEAVMNVVKAGIRGILSFSEVRINLPEGFILRNVNLAAEMETVSFYLTHPDWMCRGWF